jgi:hypothetical protein
MEEFNLNGINNLYLDVILMIIYNILFIMNTLMIREII